CARRRAIDSRPETGRFRAPAVPSLRPASRTTSRCRRRCGRSRSSFPSRSLLWIPAGVSRFAREVRAGRLRRGSGSVGGRVDAIADQAVNDGMEFRLLGPLEVVDGASPVLLGNRKQRALLARLLLDANRAVAADRLIGDLWGDNAPASAPKMVQIFVSQLRKALPDAVLLTRRPGYVVSVSRGRRRPGSRSSPGAGTGVVAGAGARGVLGAVRRGRAHPPRRAPPDVPRGQDRGGSRPRAPRRRRRRSDRPRRRASVPRPAAPAPDPRALPGGPPGRGAGGIRALQTRSRPAARNRAVAGAEGHPAKDPEPRFEPGARFPRSCRRGAAASARARIVRRRSSRRVLRARG